MTIRETTFRETSFREKNHPGKVTIRETTVNRCDWQVHRILLLSATCSAIRFSMTPFWTRPCCCRDNGMITTTWTSATSWCTCSLRSLNTGECRYLVCYWLTLYCRLFHSVNWNLTVWRSRPVTRGGSGGHFEPPHRTKRSRFWRAFLRYRSWITRCMGSG